MSQKNLAGYWPGGWNALSGEWLLALPLGVDTVSGSLFVPSGRAPVGGVLVPLDGAHLQGFLLGSARSLMVAPS